MELLDALDLAQAAIDIASPNNDAEDRAAAALDARMKRILNVEQRRKLHEKLGTSRQIVERIAREQPVQRP